MNTEKYYFSTLSKAEKEVYSALEEGFSEMKAEISVPRLPASRISEVHTMLKLDCPLLFNTDSLHITASPESTTAKVRPHYTVKKKEYSDTLEALTKRLCRVMRDCPDGTNAEKELFIHDFIVNNVKYDKLKKQYSHEVTGPLCHGIGVCEGMAKTFKLMCDWAGIPCINVIGSGVALEKTTGKKWEMHMWNLVRPEKDWLNVDVTYDNDLSGDKNIRYDYFNVTDRIMACSHSNLLFPVPAASAEGKDYYASKGRSFSKDGSLLPAVRDAFKKPYECFFRTDIKHSAELGESISEALKADRRSSRFCRYSYSLFESGVAYLILTPKEEEKP